IQVDINAAHGHGSQVDEKNRCKIDEGNKRKNANRCSERPERTETGEENLSQSTIGVHNEDAGNPSKSSECIEGDEEDLWKSSEVSLPTTKDPSIIKIISIFLMRHLMR
ncbi:hypothetical protein MKW94_008440, partial [Papaver nudicaule]|nr:hypothetical protein [Papaver nudicaule]